MVRGFEGVRVRGSQGVRESGRKGKRQHYAPALVPAFAFDNLHYSMECTSGPSPSRAVSKCARMAACVESAALL